MSTPTRSGTRIRPALPVLTAGAAALVAVILAAGCGSGSPSASTGPPATSAPRTRVVEVSPVTAAGVATGGYRTTSPGSRASCIAGSEAIGLAYRCFAANFVYDPCWVQRAAKPTVLCVPAPWSRTQVRLTVQGGLAPIPPTGPVTEPWGMQLRSGARCLLVQGAHAVFRGTVVDYYCGQDLGLLRGVDKRGRTWMARSVRMSKSGHMSAGPDEKIAIAWFGRPVRYR